MTDQFVAFIPLRGGSKSIPLKNIKDIFGQPLAYWAIDAAVNSKYIEKVYISTDSSEIKDIISSYNKPNAHKIQCINRSIETATDEATTESAMLEFAKNYIFENIILIQATNPLLTTEDLNLAIEKYKLENYDSLLSLVRQKRFIWELERGFVKPKNYAVENRPRRQEQTGFLVENGAFYITKRNLLLNTGLRISGRIGYHLMPDYTYFEIDEPSDWVIVENILKNQYRQETPKLSEVKLVAMDCDGVLTDAGMYYSENGDELKKFNTKDGMGISLLHKAGIKTVIITGENTKIVKNRAKKLGIEEVYLGIKNKVKVMDELLTKYHLTYDDVAYVGDDINDIELLKRVKYSFAVNDAMETVKESAKYVTRTNGGRGAIREIAELILNS